MKVPKEEIYKELVNITDETRVSNDPVVLWCYSKDASPLPPGNPDYVVMPEMEEEIVEVLKLANRYKIPVYPRSSGSSLWGGCIPYAGGIVLDLQLMNRIKSIDPELFSCTVEPAVTFGELVSALAEKGYYNLISPEGGLTSCVAGSFLTHGEGIGSGLWGTQGDAIIGCRVVLPTGEIVETGSAVNPSARKMAGGSGQFFRYAYAHDLTGLFCGSEGTLGVVVELTTRIEKIPESYGFVTFNFENVKDACRTLYEARLKRIQANFAALREKKSLEAIKQGEYPEAQLVYILEGDEYIVRYQLKVLEEIAEKNGGSRGEPGIAEKYWDERFLSVPGSMFKLGSRSLLPLNYPLGKMEWYYDKIKEVCDRVIVEKYELAYFIGGFQINTAFVCYPTIMFLEQYPEQYEVIMKCTAEMQEALLGLGGAPIQLGTLWKGSMLKTGAYYMLIKRIKKAIDPNNIMCPGILDLPGGRL